MILERANSESCLHSVATGLDWADVAFLLVAGTQRLLLDTMAVNQELPLTSLQGVSLATALFLMLWVYLKRYVDKHGKFAWAETLLEMHDFLVATVSMALAAYVLDIGHDVLAARTGYYLDQYTLGYLYHLLKIYEYLDIILAILSGNTVISKNAAFGHLALPYWSYFRIVNRPQDSVNWRLQVIADCFVRFLSRAVPWLVEDVKLEETILRMFGEARWYADLAITGIWVLFTIQGQREDEQALKVFGKPYEDEATAYFLSAIIMLYAGYTYRQEDAEKSQKEIVKKQPQQPRIQAKNSVGAEPASRLMHEAIRQSSRRKR